MSGLAPRSTHLPRVRMADLSVLHTRVAEATERAVLEVLRSGAWVGGPVVTEAETRLARLFGRTHGVGVNSGTDALIVALMAHGVGPGDEVLVPALTFFATAGAVARVGARPVVVDVLEDVPIMDPASAADRATPRTRAVIPVHLFGISCPDPRVGGVVIEDAAQAAGQDPPARVGVATAVSLYPTKTLPAAGDGGLVATDDPDLARAMRRLANHGGVTGVAHLHEQVGGHVGWNTRLDAIQAAVVLAHLPDLPARVAWRRHLQRTWDAALPSCCRPVPRAPGDPIHQYILRCARRDDLRAWLDHRGIDTAVYYPRSLAAQPALQPQPPTPRAEAWAAELLSLPCHSGIGQDAVDRVCDALESFAP